ncbi:BZ3500_MvSof-1268-A1-R1_Chr11-3g03535 [Microbotryum saponariae]|uniref:BZ3500_MvSof-1268-A1-R1_Chr11-3g03535 protein n=1 Tax=Microbotryum saponariae TaxID=289078 RepID=A0A2X0KML2_9BASI|nr:BZ3500_MvSof-1268-A1-R1_Chr11-3g03535 [Microbotryum saponariae]SDA03544.1 BZ3501_MvSof-1269-A2-R1_Chr11g03112 [Microbotryum saponariae]
MLSFIKSPTRALLHQISDNPCVIVGRDKFGMSVGVSSIVVWKVPAEVADHPRWRAFGHTNKAHSKILLHESDDLAALIERVDTISSLYLKPNTRWRTKDSSSEQHNLIRNLLKQRKQGSTKFIDSFWVPGREEVGGQLIIEDLTRGEACDTITRLMLANGKTIKDDLL